MDIAVLDTWIDKLMGCTPLTETEVTQLCDKVRQRRPRIAAELRAHRRRSSLRDSHGSARQQAPLR